MVFSFQNGPRFEHAWSLFLQRYALFLKIRIIWSPFLHQFWGSWSLFYAQGKSEKYYHVLFQTIAVPLHPKNSGSLRLTHGCKKIEKQGMTPT